MRYLKTRISSELETKISEFYLLFLNFPFQLSKFHDRNVCFVKLLKLLAKAVVYSILIEWTTGVLITVTQILSRLIIQWYTLYYECQILRLKLPLNMRNDNDQLIRLLTLIIHGWQQNIALISIKNSMCRTTFINHFVIILC